MAIGRKAQLQCLELVNDLEVFLSNAATGWAPWALEEACHRFLKAHHCLVLARHCGYAFPAGFVMRLDRIRLQLHELLGDSNLNDQPSDHNR